MAHKATFHILPNAFEVYEDMVRVLLMLNVLFTQDSEDENLDPVVQRNVSLTISVRVQLVKCLTTL